MICKRFELVVVPFPFVDRPAAKRRPALVLSTVEFNEAGHTVLAMITTRQRPSWPGDFRIEDWKEASLKVSCIVRLKLFTLDNRVFLRTLGRLSSADAARMDEQLRSHLFPSHS